MLHEDIERMQHEVKGGHLDGEDAAYEGPGGGIGVGRLDLGVLEGEFESLGSWTEPANDGMGVRERKAVRENVFSNCGSLPRLVP